MLVNIFGDLGEIHLDRFMDYDYETQIIRVKSVGEALKVSKALVGKIVKNLLALVLYPSSVLIFHSFSSMKKFQHRVRLSSYTIQVDLKELERSINTMHSSDGSENDNEVMELEHAAAKIGKETSPIEATHSDEEQLTLKYLVLHGSHTRKSP